MSANVRNLSDEMFEKAFELLEGWKIYSHISLSHVAALLDSTQVTCAKLIRRGEICGYKAYVEPGGQGTWRVSTSSVLAYIHRLKELRDRLAILNGVASLKAVSA